MLARLAIAVLMLAAPSAPATSTTPKAGSHAFNWLDPQHAQCKELSAKDVAKFSKCEASDNAFGLESKSLMCKVDAKHEWVVYDTAALCQEALETMQANGD
jgi:hypothetical protein